MACGQRARNAQPDGGLSMFGGAPGIGVSRSRPSAGMLARRPCVYGWVGWAKIGPISPFSATRPAYMTCTRSATRAITPRSWVIRTTAVFISRRIRCSTSRIWACTVTSSAVVGSSAIRTSGSLAIAIAIITRWRMPPENSWGNWLARSRGWGMPTMSSNSTERSHDSFFPIDWWDWIISTIWSPMRCTGFNADSGSWKIIATRLPRTWLMTFLDAPTSSVPPTVAEPSMRADFGSRLIRPRNVTDLPEPDSPTMPSISLSATSRSMPRTACTSPNMVGNVTRKSRSRSTGSLTGYRRAAAWGRWRRAARRRRS